MKNLICRLRGHKVLCSQEIYLDERGNAMKAHAHVCLRCGLIRKFDDEPLEEEYSEMLRSLAGPKNDPVRVWFDPPTSHYVN